MHTESEAKTKWCPFARIGGGQGMDGAAYNRIEHHGGDISHTAASCIGSACMAWRWSDKPFETQIASKAPGDEWEKTESFTIGDPDMMTALWQRPTKDRKGFCGLSGSTTP